MKYQLVGIPDDNALEKLQDFDEIDKVLLSPLRRINNLLGLLNDNNPEAVGKYAANLESKFQSLVDKNYVERRSIDMKKSLSELEHIKEFPMLAEHALNYLLGALKLSVDSDWSDKMKVVQRDYLRAFLSSRYYNLLVLTETIGRSNAIEIYKRHFEKMNKEWVAKNEERFQNLEEFAEDSRNADPDNPGWMRIVGEIDNGKILIRKDTCLWSDAMQDFPDSELKFLVCCYGDYSSIKVSNKHFKLTMEHSIAGGHPYCDCVIHDTRINESLDHPSDEFFANLKPST
jgi:hypothetical protein